MKNLKHNNINKGKSLGTRLRLATFKDSVIVAMLICRLRQEISTNSELKDCDIDLKNTTMKFLELILGGRYMAVIAEYENKPIGFATLTEVCLSKGEGPVGKIQEFFVVPEHRSTGVGSSIIDYIRKYGENKNWNSFEFDTPN